jgi:type II secretory pathway pseudopilin PulG
MAAKNGGFSLVELLVSIGVIVMVLVALTSGVSFAVKNTRYSKEKSLSVRHAQEAVEWVRNWRNIMGWRAFNDFYSLGSGPATLCLTSLPKNQVEIQALDGECGTVRTIVGTNFRRQLTLTRIDAETVGIDVVMTWSDSGKDWSTKISSQITNWR